MGTEFKGLKGVKECFTGLFKDLSDLSGLAAPAIRVEEASGGIAGSVFLVWRCPSSGYTHVTDTFLFDEDGKIAKQNLPASRRRSSRQAGTTSHRRTCRCEIMTQA